MTKEISQPIDQITSTAIRRVHEGQMIQLPKLLHDLEKYGAKDHPPEDKKHMAYSTLSPESIMILKRLTYYCE